MQIADSRQDMYMEFYEEVCKRTAQLVAAWQCVGFCHGDPLAYLLTYDSKYSHQLPVMSEACQKVQVGRSTIWSITLHSSACAGVLNTDNMSILGLTIDYGPYGFMDRCALLSQQLGDAH